MCLTSILFFLHQTFSFSFWTVLGTHHACDTVGWQSNPTWAVNCDTGENSRFHVQRLIKAEPADPFQRLTHGSALSEMWALTCTIFRVERSVCVRMVTVGLFLRWWVCLARFCGLVRGCSRGLLRLSLLASTLWAVVVANVWEALFDFRLTFGGRTGSSTQEMCTKRVFMTVLRSSMAV